jgi:hypothetical protein
MENHDWVTLGDAIDSLRQEIRQAADRAQHVAPNERFRITGVELELTVVAEDSVTVGGEVGWWILKARADSAGKDSITHKVKLTLNVGDIEVASGRRTGPSAPPAGSAG